MENVADPRGVNGMKHVPGGARKWKLIERAGAMEPLAGIWVQRMGTAPAKTAFQ